MSLLRGSADFLDIAANRQYAVLREYLLQQGDDCVHFSGFCCELSSTPVNVPGKQGFLSWSPLQRTLVVTSHSILYIPRTTEQSGIFFDCRLSLDKVAQVIVLDSEEYGLLVQIFVKTSDVSSAISAASPFPNLVFPGQQIAVTLLFNDASVRKSMLMALCTIRPQLPILQKKPVAQSSPVEKDAMKESTENSALLSSSRTPKKSFATYDAFKSPLAQTPTGAHPASALSGINASEPHASLSRSRSQVRFPQAKSFGTLATYAALASIAEMSPSRSSSRQVVLSTSNMTDEEFRAERERLKNELLISQLSAAELDDYDPDKAAARPPEEDPAREEEREEIRALLEARERKMSQHIEFKMKYPTKVPTRVQPGVEYDKAHEERRVLPDGHCDEELLGPSLAPLWMRWKHTGGLDGLSKRSARGGSTSPQRGSELGDEWSVFDSAELIDSLKAREEIVYGQVGPKSQARLQRMRELVQRELHMHKNRVTAAAGRLAITGGAFGSSPSRSSAKTTVPVPFSLSQSPVTLRRMKMVDADKMIAELRQSFDRHQEAVHQIRKSQLQREVLRAQGE